MQVTRQHVENILRELGIEDDDEARAALCMIEPYPAPAPTPDESTAVARAALAAAAGRSVSSSSSSPALTTRAVMLIQFRSMGARELALGLALFAAAFVAVAATWGGLLAASAVCPLYGVMFLLYSLRAGYYGVDEMESACPVGPAQLMLARLLVAGIADLAAGLAATCMVALSGQAQPGMVILSWIAPATLFAGVALAVSLEFGPTAAIGAVSVIGALGLLPRGLHLGSSPLAPVGPGGWIHWKLIYTACGMGLILLSMGKLRRSEPCGQAPGGGDYAD
jgi:hypothetical protein